MGSVVDGTGLRVTLVRHWLLPASTHAAARQMAQAQHMSQAAWVREALTDWVADIDTVRVLAPEPGEPGEVALPEAAVEDLRRLLRDPDTRRMNLWLALLAEARWPVTTLAAPLLDVAPQSVSKRVQQGLKTLDTDPQIDDLMRRLPPVPDAPDMVHPSTPGETLVSVTLRVDEELVATVSEKAGRERITMSQAVRSAIRDKLAAAGLDSDGRRLPGAPQEPR